MEVVYAVYALAIGLGCYFLGRLFKTQFLTTRVITWFPLKWKESCLTALWRAGANYRDEALLGQIILGTGLALLLIVVLPAPLNWIPLLLLLLSLTVFWQNYNHRQNQAQVELIAMAGTLSLAVSGGQDFSVALAFYTHNEEGLLVDECQEVLSRLRLGQSRETAFDHVVERYPGTREFFTAVRLSEKQGTPLAQVLSFQAKRWRQSRLHKAEANAQRLPVLLMGPLALCIFPAVFLALLGPYLIDLF